jgi:ribosomal protein L31
VTPVSGELTDTAHLELTRRNHPSFIGSQQIIPSVAGLS